MKKSHTALVVVGVIAVIGICVVCGGLGTLQSVQQQLLAKQQAVERGNAQYSGALDIVSQKIVAAYDLADKQINHEDKVFQELAEARKAFASAQSGASMPDQVAAAREFDLKFQALTESNPAFASAPVVQDSLNAVEEAVNEIFTAFQDQQDYVYGYNTYRGTWFAPKFIGDMLGYPKSFEYYEGVMDKLDIHDLVATPAN